MKKLAESHHHFDADQLLATNQRAKKILDELVKPDGIFASNDGLWGGQFHHYFGRDSAITAMLIYDAEKISKKFELSPNALQALIAISKYQGHKHNASTGEEKGKIPHEINTSKDSVARMKKRMSESGDKTWYIDKADGFLKNWDSVDSTPLWIIAIAQFIQDGWDVPSDILDKLAKASRWCISNIREFGGYAGWMPAEIQPDREFGGLTNQAWKDSQAAFEYEKGFRAVYPIHDIFSNAATWAALKYSAKVLYSFDPKLAGEANRAAVGLKWRLNKTKLGFRVKGSDFYAEALDGKLQKLTTPSIDVGMAMGMNFNNRAVIYKIYQKNIVDKLISHEFFNEALGLRTYTQNILSYTIEDQYHRGPQTFWPFTGALVAKGFDTLGFKKDAKKILKSLLLGLDDFDSFVELFQLKNDEVTLWRNSNSPQTSSLNQAWTAAAAYYASSYLLNPKKPKLDKLLVKKYAKLSLPKAIFYKADV